MIPCAPKDFKCLSMRCLKALGCQIRYEIKSRGRLVVNFSLLSFETTKLGPQRITVESSAMSWPPLFLLNYPTRITWKNLSESRRTSCKNGRQTRKAGFRSVLHQK